MMRSKGSKNHPVRTGQKLHVPVAFDAGQIPGLAGLENDANWLLHKIIFGEWLSGKPGWTRISRQTMEEFIRPANVATVLRSLRDAGAIVCDGDYLPAAVAPDGVGHSMGYGLAPAFDNTKLRTVEVTKTSLARKIKKHHADVGRFVKHDESVIEALMRGMKMTTIDRAEAYRKVSLHEFGKVPKHPGVGIVNRAAVHEKVIDTIDAGKMHATVCAYGRFHTEITRMLKGCRPHLRLNGELLASIDVKNSQPVFLAIMLLRNRGCKLAKPISADDKSALDTADLRLDEKLFVADVVDGKLYNKLMVATGYKHEDRGQFKHDFFEAVLYGDNENSYSYQSPITHFFRLWYPNVFEFVLQEKRELFKVLARKMQVAESTLIIDGVVGRISREHAEIDVLTIHDSIMCQQKYVNIVERIMFEEFAKTGLVPRLDVEPAPADDLPLVLALAA